MRTQIEKVILYSKPWLNVLVFWYTKINLSHKYPYNQYAGFKLPKELVFYV